MAAENCSSVSIFATSNFRIRIPPEVSPITNLEDELLVEILIRLPNPRHAGRCKSVCKRWISLISSHYFNRRFVSHHQSRYQPLLFSNLDSQSVIQSFLPAMPDEEVGRRFFVCDSFNDLVLCGFTDPGFRNDELGRTYIVCNPFTKQWVALPLAPKKRPGYDPSVAKLVLKPLISPDLDLGDGQVFAYSSKYQFRVVVLYRYRGSLRLDVFCSESGEWRKEVVVHDGVYGLFDGKLAYYNGALFLATGKEHAGRAGVFLVSLDPFRLDMPLTHYVDASTILIAHKTAWNIIVSQGALHLLAIKYGTPGCLTVWRLEEGCKSWRKQYELLANAPIRGKFEFDKFFPGYLHPDKPEIVFLEYRDPREERSGIYSFDLSRMAGGEDIEFFAGFRRGIPRWKMVKSRFPCCPTQIPRYEELRDMYDGSYSCWVQNNEATTLSIFEECQPVDGGVAQFAQRRKGKRSASPPKWNCGVKKPKE